MMMRTATVLFMAAGLFSIGCLPSSDGGEDEGDGRVGVILGDIWNKWAGSRFGTVKETIHSVIFSGVRVVPEDAAANGTADRAGS